MSKLGERSDFFQTQPENGLKVLPVTLLTHTQNPFITGSCVDSAVELII